MNPVAKPTKLRPFLKRDILRHSSVPEKSLERAMTELKLRSPFTEDEVYQLLVRAHSLHGAFLHKVMGLGN